MIETLQDSASRIRNALNHRHPDRVPVDFGGSFISGMHVSGVAALRECFGLERRPVHVIDPGQMLGEIDEELKRVIGIDTEGVFRRMTTRYAFHVLLQRGIRSEFFSLDAGPCFR